jgi:hypothetical protein
MKQTHPLTKLGNRPPRLGVTLPVPRDAVPISDEEYKGRLHAFMQAHGYPNPRLGFFGNWAFHARLEEEFRHVLTEELAKTGSDRSYVAL